MKAILKKRAPKVWAVIAAPVKQFRHLRYKSMLFGRLCCCAYDDFFSFLKHSGSLGNPRHPETSAAKLRKNYHRVEKGLALPETRPGFGKDLIRELIRDLKDYEAKAGYDYLCELTVAALASYLQWHRENAKEDTIDKDNYKQLCEVVENKKYQPENGGVFYRTKDELSGAAVSNLPTHLGSRHSIRMFSDKIVDRQIIEDCVALASKAPSACNRQGWAVFAFDDPQRIAELLMCQNGNRGFGEYIKLLLIVCGDQSAFPDPLERNQAYVDGGMFSMTLLQAFHYHGLGTCPLNLSIGPKKRKQLFKLAGIANRYVPVMMIGAGHLPERLTIARSFRRHSNEILFWDK